MQSRRDLWTVPETAKLWLSIRVGVLQVPQRRTTIPHHVLATHSATRPGAGNEGISPSGQSVYSITRRGIRDMLAVIILGPSSQQTASF